MIHYKILLLRSMILLKLYSLRERAVSELIIVVGPTGYRLYACIFRESRNIKSRRRHRASAMVVWAPLLFSQ